MSRASLRTKEQSIFNNKEKMDRHLTLTKGSDQSDDVAP